MREGKLEDRSNPLCQIDLQQSRFPLIQLSSASFRATCASLLKPADKIITHRHSRSIMYEPPRLQGSIDRTATWLKRPPSRAALSRNLRVPPKHGGALPLSLDDGQVDRQRLVPRIPLGHPLGLVYRERQVGRQSPAERPSANALKAVLILAPQVSSSGRSNCVSTSSRSAYLFLQKLHHQSKRRKLLCFLESFMATMHCTDVV